MKRPSPRRSKSSASSPSPRPAKPRPGRLAFKAKLMFEPLEPRVMMSVTQAVESAAAAGGARAQQHSSLTKSVAQPIRNIVAIDATLAVQGLAPANISADTRVIYLTPNTDPLAQITAALAGTRRVQSIQIFTHGSSGQLDVGPDSAPVVIDERTLTADSSELAKWNKFLAPDAVIALYGCDVAQGKGGQAFVKALARRTGATVAANTAATGAASLGGTWTLDYLAGKSEPVGAPDIDESFDGLLGAVTLATSTGSTSYVITQSAAAIDPAFAASTGTGGLTLSGASAQIAAGFYSAEDVLALPATTGYSASYNSTTGVLSITSTSAESVANWQAVLRTVTYQDTLTTAPHLDARGITFTLDSITSAAKTVTPALPVDSATQTQIVNALTVVGGIGTAIDALSGTPLSTDTTSVPYTSNTIAGLLYPTTLSDSVQPTGIGTYLQLAGTATTYFAGAGTITNLTGLAGALTTKLAAIVPGTNPLLNVSTTFTEPADTDVRSLSMVVTIANSKGASQTLDLSPLQTDLGITFPGGPTVTVGGGADIQFTISINLQGHTYGSTLASSDVTLTFNRLNAFAGLAFGLPANTAINVGAIGGTTTGASGILGADIPIALTGGNSKTLNNWSTTGTEVSSFATAATSTCSVTIPIAASIGSVSATTSSTSVVVADPTFLSGGNFTYTTTAFSQLKYFATITPQQIIQEVQKVGTLYSALDSSDASLFGVNVPMVKDVTLGDLADFSDLFNNSIGTPIGVSQPILNTNGTQLLTGENLPIASGQSSIYSDLQSEFQFGVQINGSETVTPVTVAASSSRSTLDDLVTALNAAFTTAGVDITASNDSDKLSFTSSNLATVQSFNLVPVQPTGDEAGEHSPTSPPSDLSTIPVNTPEYYTVTGTTTGTVTGTTYYDISTPLAAAAVHAGILAAGQTGTVEVVRVGATGQLAGSTLNGITSVGESSAGDAYIVTYADDLSRLGVGTGGGLLESTVSNTVTASLPLQAVLTGSAALSIGNGTNSYTVSVASNSGNTSITQTLTNVQSALTTAGIASDVSAQLVDNQGNILSGAPATGTSYYLQFYLPTGSTWTTLAVSPTSSVQAYQVLPLGFLVGDESTAQLPTSLQTFQDFENHTLFPNLTITPVYTSANNTVTLEFSATNTTAPAETPDFTFAISPLGQLEVSGSPTFTPSVTSSLAFGVQFNIGPAAPVQLIGSTDLPTNGQLSADSTFTLSYALGDTYSVTVPHTWTTNNTSPQDLVADINLALTQATDTTNSNASTDLTSSLIAQLGGDGKDLVLTNATPVGTQTTLTQANGVLSSNLSLPFTYQGTAYTLQLPASDTSGNTTFSQLLVQLNSALASCVAAGGSTVSLSNQLFFTTVAGANGAAATGVRLFSTSPVGATWPTSIALSANRTDPMVATLGFTDGGTATTSTVSAQASGVNAVLVNNGTTPIASVSAQMSTPSAAGSVPYGFSTIDFGASSGAVNAVASVALSSQTQSIDAVGSDPDAYLTRTLTNSSGSGTAAASFTLSTLSSSGATIASGSTITINIADLSAANAQVFEPLGQPIPVPDVTGGVLSADQTVNFLDGTTLYSVTVAATSTTSNTSFTQLAADFNSALTAATESVSGGTPTAIDASGLFQIARDSTGTQLLVSALTTVANPNFAQVTFLPGLSSFGSLAYQGAFGPAAVATGLDDVLPILTNLQSSMPLLSQFNLPLINTPLNQLLNINGSLLNQISAFSNMTVSSAAGIAPALASALNIPANQVQVSYDSANDAYRIDLQYQTAVATTKPLDMTLADFYEFTNQTEPAGLERLVDSGSNSPLTVNVGATVTLALGIDLSNPNAPRPFLYGYDGSGNYGLTDGTSIQYSISAVATNITFTAATGSLGVYVEGGEASIGGPPDTGDNGQPVYTYNDDPNELSLVRSSNAALLSIGLQGQGDSITTSTDASSEKFYIDGNAAANNDLDGTDTNNFQAVSFTGSVEANLPVFTPTQFDDPFTNLAAENVNVLSNGSVTNQSITPGGNVVNLQIIDIGAFANDSLSYNSLQSQINTIYTNSNGTPNSGQQTQIATLQSQQAAIAQNGDVVIYSPDVSGADSSETPPTLIDALQDPSLLVDGIQTVLGGVGTALKGLDDLDIPVIGPVLGDAVKDVFSWDNGWLADLKAQLRNRGTDVFSELQDELFNYLGPSGLNILLENNGESGVNSIIPAQSADDVGIQFLNSSGQVMTGATQGADAVQFTIQLGSLLVNTGANLGFNFNDLSPAFSLALNGGLTFKLGWEASLGFGYSLKDGFYVVTNSTPGVNQMELQFAAGLSGAEASYTIAANGSGGYGIKDSSGNWVQGPTESGTQNLSVIEVDNNGDPVTTITLPSSSSSWGSSATTTTTSSQTYWVVAINGVPAEMNDLGQYVAQTADSNGDYDGTQEILYNQTAPLNALGSLFFFNLSAVDQQQIGIHPPTDADYYFSTGDMVTANERNDSGTGVNRNNDLPTVISGTIGIKLVDPSANASNYVARPGISPTGFILMDGSNDLGGNPVLDDDGNDIPVMESAGAWYYAVLDDSTNSYVIGDPITTDESPNRITFQEMQDAGTSIFELDLTAQAVVNLNLTLSIGNNAAIPKLTASFNLDWQYQKTFGGPDAESADGGDDSDAPKTTDDKLSLLPQIGINNVRLDLGSFLSEFIKPIATKINDALAPIDPLLQDLETAIPIISDIAGHPVTLTTLLADFGGGDGAAIATFIDLANDVAELSNLIANLPAGADAYIPIGNFWLANVSAGPGGQPGEGEQIYYDNSQLTSLSILQRNQSLIADPGAGANALTNALGSVENIESGNGAAAGSSGGFDFPILDNPMTIFGLIMGRTESLVTFSLPKLNFDFDQDIPLIKIVCFEVGLHINIDITGQLDIGYDTYGLQEYEQDHNPADILDGFYISTRVNADGTGAEADALDVHASIGLYGGIDVVLAKAGIEGGFEVNASIAWNDPNNDGKLRLPEMIDLVEAHDDPLDLADISIEGDVYARYYYWVGIDLGFFTVTLFQGGDTFAQIPLFDLTRDGQDGAPVFANVVTTQNAAGQSVPGTLNLNMGPTADQRISNEDPLNSTDNGAEHFKVWNNSSNPSTVYVQYLNYSTTTTQTFTGISEVLGIAGPAGDSIDASGLNGIPVNFTGDAGNDTFELGSGSTSTPSTIDAGSGNNTVTVTGGGLVTIDADGSNDTITTGSGSTAADTVAVSSGNNTITAGGNGANNTIDFNGEFGNNSLTLSPSATTNVLDFSNSDQAVTANLSGASSTITAGSANKVTFNLADATLIRGSQGDDIFNVTDPTTENANSGEGLILQGGSGDEDYNVTADTTSGIASDGITIEGEAPTTLATAGAPTLCEPSGYIMSIPVTDGGVGYLVPPTVVINDPDGSGARAVASLNDQGTVTGIYVLDGGTGYTTNATVTLVEPTPFDNKLSYTSSTTGTVTLDENGNSDTDYELSTGSGGPIKWVGTATPGQVRSADYDVDEIDDVSVSLPDGNLALNSHVDLEGDLTVASHAITQSAPITANDVSITTDEGIAVNNEIDTINNGDITLESTGAVSADNVPAVATATVVNGAVTAFTITNPGAGYLFPPTITIDDPNGTGARAVGEIANGELTGIVLIAGGSGYFSTPAPVVDIAPPSSIQLNANLTTSTVGSAPGTGDGRGTVNLRANLGAIDQTGDVAFPTGSNIAWNDGDFVYQGNNTLSNITTAQYPQASVGSGATAQAVIDSDGRVVALNVTSGGSGYSQSLLPTVQIDGGATATAIVDPQGAVTGFHITYPGSGYAVAPTVTIVANGFGYVVGDTSTTQSTQTNREQIDSQGGSLVAVAYDGIGDPNKPLKTDVSNMVGQTFALAAGIHVLQNNSVTVGQAQNIDGLNTVNGNISVTTFGGTMGLGSPEQLTNADGQLLWQDASKTVPIYATDDAGNIIYQGGNIASGDGQVKLTADRIQVNNYLHADGGQLILQPVNPDAPIGLPGTQATANANIASGEVTSLTPVNQGVAYTTAPLVILTPPGQRAFATATVADGEVQSLQLTYGGTNYNANALPIVTLTGGGEGGATPNNPATVTATYDPTSGEVTGFTITSAGSGYVSSPTVNISLPGTQATATAIVTNGKVSGYTIVNPGSNYSVAPGVTVDAPFPFTLDQQEVEYFNSGFNSVIVGRADGRSPFYAPDASIAEPLELRSPLGGDMQVNDLEVEGPLNIVGSGQGMELTASNPTVSGTSININNNVVVDNATTGLIQATGGDVDITGSGVGNIDGASGSTTANLTLEATGNILVGGAIGSSNPLDNLTITSNGTTPGNVTIQGNVSLTGNLTITAGENITFGGNVSIGGDLIIDQGASVSFNGTVTAGGHLLISNASTVSFAQNVNVADSFTVGQSSNPNAVESLTLSSNARLDAGTVAVYTTDDITFGNRVGQSTPPAAVSLDSAQGDVNFAGAVTAAGTISITNADNVTFANNLTAPGLVIQLATGEVSFERAATLGSINVTSQVLVETLNQLIITTGNGTITSNAISFQGGSGSIYYSGTGSSTLTIKPYNTSESVRVGSPPGAAVGLDISDVDLDAIGGGFARVNLGDSANGTGPVTIGSIGSQEGAGNSQLLNPTSIFGGSIDVVQNVDSAAGSGDLNLFAATGNINIDAAINSVAAERCATVWLQTTAGQVILNAPVYASNLVRIVGYSGSSETASGYVVAPNLRISTTTGPVAYTNSGNSIAAVAIFSTNNAITLRNDHNMSIGSVDGINGITSGSANTSITDNGGTVTQTQPISAAGLELLGAGGTFTLTQSNNVIGTIAAHPSSVSLVDSVSLTVGVVNSTTGIVTDGNLSLVTAGALTVNDSITATNGGAVTLTAQNGDVTIADAAAITAPGAITVSASLDIIGGGAISGGSVSLTANRNLALDSSAGIIAPGTVGLTALTGNLADSANVGTTGAISVSAPNGTVAVAGLAASIGSVNVSGASTINLNGAVSSGAGAVSATAPLDLLIADAASVTAGGNITLSAGRDLTGGGAVGAGGTVSMTAGRNLTADAAETITAAHNITLTATTALAVAALVDSTAGAVAIEAQNSTASVAGVEAEDDVQITGATGVSLNGPISSTTGSVTATATANNLTVADAASITSGADVTLTAPQNLTGGGPIAAVGTVTLSAGDNLTGDASDSIQGDAGVTLTAGENLSQIGVVQSSAGNITLTATAGALAAGGIVANGSALITGHGQVNLNGGITAVTGVVTVTSQTADVAIADIAAITAASNIGIAASTNITGGGAIDSTAGNATLAAGGSITNDSSAVIQGAVGVSLTASLNVAQTAALESSGGSVGVSAVTGTVTLGAITAADAVNITADTAVALNGAITATTGTVSATSQTASLALADAAPITAAGAITLSSATTLTGGGAVDSTAGAVSLTAGTTLTGDADFSITGNQGVTLAASGGTTLAAPISSGVNLAITDNSGDIALSDAATLTATGNVTITGAHDLTGGGAITAGGTVTISAANDYTGDAADEIQGAGGVSITAAQNLAQTGVLQSSAGPVALTATNGTLAVAGITADGAVTITGHTATNLYGGIISTTGTVAATSQTAGLLVADAAPITAAGSIDLSAATTLDGGGAIASSDTVTLDAGDSISGDAYFTLSGTSGVTVTSTNSLTLLASVASTAGAVSIESDASTVWLAGVAGDTGVTITGNGGTTLTLPISSNADLTVTENTGDVAIDDPATLAATGDVSITGAHNISGGGAITAGGTATISAANNYTGDSADSITGADGVSITAAENLSQTGVLQSSAGPVALTATNGTLAVSGITADDAVNITGAQAVTLNGGITSVSDAVTATSQDASVTIADAAPITAAGDISVAAATALSGGGAIDSSASVTLSAGTTITGDTDMTIAGASGVGITAAGALSLSAAVTSSAGSVAIASTGSTVSLAAVSGDTGVTITGNGGTTLNAPISASAGGIIVTDNVAGISVTDAATVSAAHIVQFNSAANIAVGGAISGSSVQMTAAGNYVGDSHNSINTSGNITFQIGGQTTDAAPIHTSNGTTSITTDGATLAAINSHGEVTINSTGTVNLNGQITVHNSGVSITAHNSALNINSGATIHAPGNIVLNAGQNLSDSAAITSTGDSIEMISTTGTVSAATIAGADGVSISGDVGVNLNGPVASSAGNVTVSTQTDDLLISDNATITSAGDVNLTAARNLIGGGAITASGAVTLSAAGALTADTAATITASSASLTVGTHLSDAAPIQTSGTIALDAQAGALVLAATGFLSAGGNITLTSANQIDTAANATSTGGTVTYASPTQLTGNVSVTGNTGITFASTVNGDQTLTLTSSGPIALQSSVGSSTPLAALVVTSAGSLTTADVAAGHVIQLAGLGATTLGPITATDSLGVNIESTGAITATGPIESSAGPVTLTSNALTVNSTINSAGPMTLDGANHLTLGSASALSAGSGSPIVITSDAPVLGGAANSIRGNSTLLIQPADSTTAMTVGASAAGFDLTDAQLASIAPGFSHLTIGNAASNGAVTVASANFTSPVTIQSPAADGSVTVNGNLTTTDTGDSITIDSGGNLTVDGMIDAVSSVDLVADSDGNGIGSIIIADAAPTTIESQTGSLTITGENVYVGSTNAAATLSAPQGSLDIEDSTAHVPDVGAAPGGPTVESASSTGVIDINNANTTLNVSGDVHIGASGTQPTPKSVNVQGNIVAGGSLSVDSVSDADFYQFRVRTGQTINVLGGNTVNANNGSFLSTGGAVNLLGGATGSSVNQNSTVISEASALPLSVSSYGKKIADNLRAGDSGKAYVRITNTGTTDAVGSATIVAYATPNGGLAADQSAIGQTKLNVSLKPGQSKIVPVVITIPATLAAGTYQVALEQVPYRGTVTPTANGQLQITDPNVANVGSITVGIPHFTGTVTGSFAKNKLAKVSVLLTNTGPVESTGSADIAIYASSDGSLTGATPLDTIAAPVSIKAGKSKKFSAAFALPASLLPSHSYQLIAVVHPIPSSINYAAPDTQISGAFFTTPVSTNAAAA